MQKLVVFFAAVMIGAVSLAQGTQDSQEPPREGQPASKKPLDPALRPVDELPGLPRVLLIGDSISMGYTMPVRELLKGEANVQRPPVNCGMTQRGLDHLDEWLGTNQWDVIHFNFGLHDLKYLDDRGQYVDPAKGKQVAPLPLYEKNLREIVVRLKRSGARLIWCSTTPVPDGTLGRIKGDEIGYNQVAERVMRDNGVAIDDLHALIEPHQAEWQLKKNVHFTAEGYRRIAVQVAASIERELAMLPRRSAKTSGND
jgi:hypothetical protein